TSSACPSGTLLNSSVSGPPGMRSTLTTLVCPTRAHSERIWRTVASFATIDTRPLFKSTCTSAEAAEAVSRHAPTAHVNAFSMSTILLLSEVIDDLGQDFIKVVFRLVANEAFDPRQVGHPAGHVLESRLVRLV